MRRGDRQEPASSTRPTIPIEPNHRLVLLTDRVDWTELLEFVEGFRQRKGQNAAGRPQFRALTGALLKATRDVTWREAADLIRHRAGRSQENVERLKKLGVAEVGLAPRGRCE